MSVAACGTNYFDEMPEKNASTGLSRICATDPRLVARRPIRVAFRVPKFGVSARRRARFSPGERR